MLNIADVRLANQRISQTTFKEPAEVAHWMGPMQGQDYTGAKWSVGLRLPHSTDAAIEQAISDKRIVRTWIMRGTLHLVAAADVRWMTALVGPKLIAGNTRRYRQLELDSETLIRSNDVLANALRDGARLSRTELVALLEQEGISTKGQRTPYMLQRASYDGLICQGAAPRSDPIYMALDSSFPTVTWTREEAIAKLFERYIMSRGPATLPDFVQWSGLLISEAKAALAGLSSQLRSDTVGGKTYWRSLKIPSVPDNAPTLYLLPGFDEYLLGYKDRRDVLDPKYAKQVCPGGNGVFMPTIVSEGRVIGIWRRAFKKGSVIITPQPFSSLSDEEHVAFAKAAQGYADFLGMPMGLSFEVS